MVCPKLWGTNNVGMGTLGDPVVVFFVGTLGDPYGVASFTGTLGGAISVWKISVSSCIILFVVSPLRNGVRGVGFLIADDSSSIVGHVVLCWKQFNGIGNP